MNEHNLITGSGARQDRQSGIPARVLRPVSVGPQNPGKTAPGQLLEYLQVLRRHKWLLLGLALCGLIGSIIITALTPPMYRARISLDVKGSGDNLPAIPDASSGIAYPPEGFVQTEIKILQSQSLAGRVVSTMLSRFPTSPPARPGIIPGWQPRRISRKAEIEEAAHLITVRALGTTRIVEVLCDARDPETASAICNTLADEYIQQNLENRWRLTQETGDWLNRYVENVKHRLTQTESELQSSATAAALLFNSDSDTLAQEKLRQLQTELSKSQAERMTKQSQYEMATSHDLDSLPLVMDNEVLRTYQLKITDLRRQVAENSSTLTPEHYKMKQFQAQLREEESALQKARGEILKRMHDEFEAARRREDLIASAYEAQVSQVTSEAGKSVQHNMLKREVDSGRKVYESMLEKVEEVGLASAMRASTIRVLDRAFPPNSRFTPNLTNNSLAGISVGLFLGVLVTLILSRSDRSLQGPGDTPLQANVRELGAIPAVNRRVARHLRKNGRAQLSGSTSQRTLDLTPRENWQLELTTWQNRSSVIAESFSAIMNSILFNGVSRLRSDVMVVTSPETGDGKTTVATNLAIALAQIGHRVLLIDGDMRKPRIHNVFNLSNDAGLVNILRDTVPVSELPVSDMAMKTPVTNLSVLVSGHTSDSPSDLLHSDRLRELLWRLRQDFEVILIDTPPMALISDARVFGRLAEGVLLVFRADRTTRDLAAAAQQRFLEDGTPVLGTILNDWDVTKSRRYGTYSSYGSYINN